ncbi:DUF721 domain-containing protein [Stagnihabitans tardus]|nr:DciA family protein [Stagnihabitans tardus]
MAPKPDSPPKISRRMRGFEAAGQLLTSRIRAAGETRGFAVARLLTAWDEIAGDAAPMTRPVKVGYGREGLGGTLTLLVQTAHAPMVQMLIPKLIERVNAAYGYAAISRIILTQTAASGFAEGQTPFQAPKRAPDPVVVEKAQDLAAPVHDEGLRSALELLGRNILTRRNPQKGPT